MGKLGAPAFAWRRRAIRRGNQHMTLGFNDCGLNAGAGFGASGAYRGTTSQYANINRYGRCTNKFSYNLTNTVSWGPFDSSTTLAVTCSRWGSLNGVMIETDIYLRSNGYVL